MRSPRIARVLLVATAMLLALPTLASAAATVEKDMRIRRDVGGIRFTDCAGEEFMFSGYALFKQHVVIDEGGHVHGELHINGQGVTVTGLTTGTTYRFLGNTNYTFTGRLDETGAFTETFIATTRHIAPGPDNKQHAAQGATPPRRQCQRRHVGGVRWIRDQLQRLGDIRNTSGGAHRLPPDHPIK